MDLTNTDLSPAAKEALNRLHAVTDQLRWCDERLGTIVKGTSDLMPYFSEVTGKQRLELHNLIAALDSFVATYAGRR